MSQLVKTKRQVNLKDFKRFGAFKELVEQKNVVFNSFLLNWAFFGTFYINYYICHCEGQTWIRADNYSFINL
jgi:hypothetical protein